jgi:hypothetical protein
MLRKALILAAFAASPALAQDVPIPVETSIGTDKSPTAPMFSTTI